MERWLEFHLLAMHPVHFWIQGIAPCLLHPLYIQLHRPAGVTLSESKASLWI